jgi:RNA polymerase sigma factor (TIGR02999 family)
LQPRAEHPAQAVGEGDPGSSAVGTAQGLGPSVYRELRRMAAQKLANEKPGHTLQPTALVHEAYLRLRGSGSDTAGGRKWNSDAHFYAAAAEAMRRILVESARRKRRVKHGGQRHRVELDEQGACRDRGPDEIVALDEALTLLAGQDPLAAQVVELHFFAGLPLEQVGQVLGMSRATTYRQWAFARAWLNCAMGGGTA